MRPLPTEGAISALNIPHSSIVFGLYQITEIQAKHGTVIQTALMILRNRFAHDDKF